MSPTILLLLACATLSFSIPFPSSATTSVVASHVANAKQVLTHQLSDRESLNLSPSDRQGVNFSPCTSNTDCFGSRFCVTVTEANVQLCSTDCVCAPADPQDLFCNTQSDCDSFEVCAAIAGRNVCIDERLAPPPGPRPGTVSPTTTAGTIATSPTTPTAATTVTGPTTSSTIGIVDSPAASGVTLDPCRDAADCRGPRDCLNLEDAEFCDGDGCRCFPGSIAICENDSECDEGESCFSVADVSNLVNIPFLPDAAREVRACASRAAVQALSGDPVCIGAHSLGHISREELVFENHAVAHVLCDVNNSCATPGHMVQYKGKGMMMKSYCELTGCTRKIMLVNSPKYRRGLTVASSTENLVFTALAARFESRAEEGVLSAAVRLGF